MSNERNFGVLGFLAGAAIGATLGILFAPRSGKETRDRMARGAADAKDDLDEMIDKARSEWSRAKGKAADTASMTKEEVSDFIRFLFEEGRDLASRVKNDVEDVAGETTHRARQAADHIRHGAN
ncbi:MAG: YtxH domain-containing protein [Flavobacteriales bacterium]|nr:YtxH domain-containing protein [Flavobacteriales bacterium]MBK7752417.1 YtxH domain-containing protein [Flavobacteriales bacterium]